MTVGPVQKEGLGIVKYNAAIQITSRTVIDTSFEAAMVRRGLEADHVHVTNDKRGDMRGSIKYIHMGRQSVYFRTEMRASCHPHWKH